MASSLRSGRSRRWSAARNTGGAWRCPRALRPGDAAAQFVDHDRCGLWRTVRFARNRCRWEASAWTGRSITWPESAWGRWRRSDMSRPNSAHGVRSGRIRLCEAGRPARSRAGNLRYFSRVARTPGSRGQMCRHLRPMTGSPCCSVRLGNQRRRGTLKLLVVLPQGSAGSPLGPRRVADIA